MTVRKSILRSIQVSQPKTIPGNERGGTVQRPWRTSLFKEPVDGPLRLEAAGLVGDAQADLRHHGGTDKAICAYPTDHYAYWESRLHQTLPNGAFGENFSVLGHNEASVCIGDTFQIGDAIVQVTQPRSPCWKIARRWHKKLALWFQETGFTGWYLRVLKPGTVEPGHPIDLIQRPHEAWTIQRVNLIRYHPAPDPEALTFLAQCEALSENWRTRFQQTLTGNPTNDDHHRLGQTP